MNAIIVYIDRKIRIIPKMKFIMSFCNIFFIPSTSKNDLSVCLFFFLLISVSRVLFAKVIEKSQNRSQQSSFFYIFASRFLCLRDVGQLKEWCR